nr:hypothetical protein [Tanacetum cinerariifolium]
MAARGGGNNLVTRRVIDDLIDISRERSLMKYLKIIIEQQIFDHQSKAIGDYEEVFDLVMELWDDRRDEKDKVVDFNRLIIVAEEKIHGKEIDFEMLKDEGMGVPLKLVTPVGNVVFGFWQVYSERLLHRFSFGRINWFSNYMDEYNHDPLVNYDNDNEIDDLAYQSEEYFDQVQEDDENNHLNGNVVNRGITRLYKF